MDKEREYLERIKQRIYEEYTAIIERLVMRGIDIDEVPHVASKVVINAVDKRYQLRDMDKLKSWLMKITDNTAYAHFKEQAKLWEREVAVYTDVETGEEIGIYESIKDEDSSVEEIVMTAVRNEMLWELTANLSEKEFMIFKLHNIEGYELVEISKKLKMNYNTVRSIHSRACKKLKRRGEKLFGKEGMI